MIIKCVSAAESLNVGLSYLFWGSETEWEDQMGFDPYYLCIVMFGVLVSCFSIGNIEHSKIMQITIVFLRFFAFLLLLIGCIVSMFQNGVKWGAPHVKAFDFTEIHFVFGNTIFINLFHHSIPGIFYPLRPQKNIRITAIWCFAIGFCLHIIEAFLALLAFGNVQNNDPTKYPARIQVLYIYTYL